MVITNGDDGKILALDYFVSVSATGSGSGTGTTGDGGSGSGTQTGAFPTGTGTLGSGGGGTNPGGIAGGIIGGLVGLVSRKVTRCAGAHPVIRCGLTAVHLDLLVSILYVPQERRSRQLRRSVLRPTTGQAQT